MTDLPKTADAVIIGGGVIGMSVARALSLRGLRDVVLIERGGLGSEASSAAAGMLAPQAEADASDEFFKLCCRSRDMYAVFAESLREETGIDVELDTTGTLYLAFTDEDVHEIEHRFDWQSKAGLVVERLPIEKARKLEPCISEHARAALKFPLDIQVENRHLVSALASSNAKLGVRLITRTNVKSVRMERSHVAGVETEYGFMAAPYVIVSTGAWTSFIDVSETKVPRVTIEPVRGQMLSLESNPNVTQHVIYSPRGYIVPRRDGRLLAGSTTEHAGFEKCVTAAGTHAILSHALEISPRLADLPVIDSWAGLRPRALDGFPVLGPYQGLQGLVYATGHYRNGILLAPITGELIAEAILDNFLSPLINAFAPDRFDLVGVE